MWVGVIPSSFPHLPLLLPSLFSPLAVISAVGALVGTAFIEVALLVEDATLYTERGDEQSEWRCEGDG